MIKKLYFNLINSLNGIKNVLSESSFILELMAGFILLPYVYLSNVEFFLKSLIFILYFLLLAFEIVNTAIEKLCNKITLKKDKDIKIIKDLSSAAVFIILIILTIVTLTTFLN